MVKIDLCERRDEHFHLRYLEPRAAGSRCDDGLGRARPVPPRYIRYLELGPPGRDRRGVREGAMSSPLLPGVGRRQVAEVKFRLLPGVWTAGSTGELDMAVEGPSLCACPQALPAVSGGR